MANNDFYLGLVNSKVQLLRENHEDVLTPHPFLKVLFEDLLSWTPSKCKMTFPLFVRIGWEEHPLEI